jgi:hypothetical protein
MNEQSRALQAFALARSSNQEIELTYLDLEDAGDGSFIEDPKTERRLGTIADLQQTAIERLREGGMDIAEGITCGIPEELELIPDRARYNMLEYKIIDYARGEGVTVLTLARQPMGNAAVDPNA